MTTPEDHNRIWGAIQKIQNLKKAGYSEGTPDDLCPVCGSHLLIRQSQGVLDENREKLCPNCDWSSSGEL